MITEDYVSFETAKLLEEKGFEGECSRFYMPSGHGRWKYEHYHDFDISDRIECPTLQVAMKWLREVHNIHVVPKFDFYAGNYTGRIYDGRRESATEKDDYIAIVGNSTYEEACEAAIGYCLEKLI